MKIIQEYTKYKHTLNIN